MPQSICEIIRYCSANDIKAVFSRNEPAGGCLDASKKRVRSDGRVGIALSDEMKSLVVTYIDAEKNRRYAAVHCRGDRSIDFRCVKLLLPARMPCKARISLLDELMLSKLFRMHFGIVNPVLLDIRSGGQLLQIFDEGLLNGTGPNMLATNAGELTWGMQIDAKRLVKAIGPHITGSVCK